MIVNHYLGDVVTRIENRQYGAGVYIKCPRCCDGVLVCERQAWANDCHCTLRWQICRVRGELSAYAVEDEQVQIDWHQRMDEVEDRIMTALRKEWKKK